MPKEYTTQEAGEILGITDSAVRQRIDRGVLKGKKRGGRVYVSLDGTAEESESEENIDEELDAMEYIAHLPSEVRRRVLEWGVDRFLR